MSTHRSKTRRKALAWQVGGIALAAGAVALFILPIGNFIRPAAAHWDNGTQVANAGTGPSLAVLSPDEAARIGDILRSLAPAKLASADAAPGEQPGDIDIDIPAVDNDPVSVPSTPSAGGRRQVNWTYIGSAVTPRATRALVRIDQNQKFIREGTEFDGVKLVEVKDDYITIEEGGMQRRIDRAPMLANAMLDPPRNPAGATATRPAVSPPTPIPPGGASPNAANGFAANGKTKIVAGAPGRLITRMNSLPPEMRVQTYQVLTSVTASHEERVRAIAELGFDPDASIDERREAIRVLNLNPDEPSILKAIEDEMNGAARDQR